VSATASTALLAAVTALALFLSFVFPPFIARLRFRRNLKMLPTAPILDIVMLVHDQAGWADLAIRSIEHFTVNPYRLIIVDMASVELRTKKLLDDAEARGHKVIRLATNKSFSNGCNVGALAGTAPFLCFLNDDCIVTEGWDAALVQDAGHFGIGLVGARSNYASGAQMDPSFVGEPPYLVFVCVALRRSVWEKVGPMDEETFSGFSCEDIDYSWRVRKAGYKLAVSSAFVLHAGSRTLSQTVGAFNEAHQTTELRAKNDQKYNARLIDKHGKEWAAQHTKLVQKVLVASYHTDTWCSTDFMDAFVKLKGYGGYAFEFIHAIRMPIAHARNGIADQAVDNGFDWLVQLDDDALFPPNLIQRFLVHQKDVVCALAYQRKPPHRTCAFDLAPDGVMGTPLEGIEHTGLRRVDVSGFHCSIMHTSVIKRLREGGEFGGKKVPGTRHYYGWLSQTDAVGEDFAMCANLRALGIKIYVDTDLVAGHVGDAIVVDEAYKKAFLASGK
jgi:GT2 family glycosyltransferase